MRTALEKHRRTAQHSTDRRGQTNHCLISIYGYIYNAGTIATNSLCLILINLLQQLSAQRVEVIKQVEPKHPAALWTLSCDDQWVTAVQHRHWNDLETTKSAGVEHHLVAEPGHAGKLHSPLRSRFTSFVSLNPLKLVIFRCFLLKKKVHCCDDEK